VNASVIEASLVAETERSDTALGVASIVEVGSDAEHTARTGTKTIHAQFPALRLSVANI
jgi:hypothetical protein